MFPIGAEVSHLPHVRAPRMLQFIPVDIDCRIGKELVASTVIAMQMGIHDNIYVSESSLMTFFSLSMIGTTDRARVPHLSSGFSATIG